MSTSPNMRAPHWLALAAVGLALAGCQAEDQGRPTRDQAGGLVMDALLKVRELDTSAAAIAAALPAQASELRTTVAVQRQRLGAIKDALGSYGGRAEAIAECECNGNIEDFASDVQRELGGLGEVGSALNAVKAASASPGAAAVPAAPSAYAHKLPTGVELSAAGGGVEEALVTFIEDAARPVDKATWFDFDQLTFKQGAAALDMAKSKPQLENIAAILKAYPAVKLKIGGYTDNTGPAAANKKLSQGRADAVLAAVAGLGVDKARLEAEGYGPEFPVCAANDSEACKAQNRRVAVRVTAK
jgi:outer membrane protein OmpA-like peptidoglycan-associated protein